MVDFRRALAVTRLRDLLREAFKVSGSSIGPEEWDALLMRVAAKVYDGLSASPLGAAFKAATDRAAIMAAAGPRVAAVVLVRATGEYDALPGFICAADNDAELMARLEQVALVDPDGALYFKEEAV